MHVRTCHRFIAIASAIFPIALAAQSATPPAAPASGHMVLHVVVTPKSGPPVAGLHQQDFTLFDNKTPVPITGFTEVSGANAPVEVVLVIDTVNATTDNLSVERAEVVKFLKANGGHLAFPTYLGVLQEDGVAMGENPTRDGNLLSTAFTQINLGTGVKLANTGASNDADRAHRCLVAAQRLGAKLASLPGRKIVLWLSPGWPLVSDPNYNYDDHQQQQLYRQAIVMTTQMQREEVTFYTVNPAGVDQGVHQRDYEVFVKGAAKSTQAVPADTALQVLSVQSGGQALTGSYDLASQLQQCLADLTAYYDLTFDPPPDERRDDLHTLQVKVSQPGLTARTRAIYYSEP